MLYFTLVYFYIYRASWSNDFFCMFRKSSETQEQRPLLIRNTLSYVTVILDALKRKKKKYNISITLRKRSVGNEESTPQFALAMYSISVFLILFFICIVQSHLINLWWYWGVKWFIMKTYGCFFSFLYRTVFISLNCSDAVFHHVVWTPDGAVCLKMLSFWKSGKRLNLNS